MLKSRVLMGTKAEILWVYSMWMLGDGRYSIMKTNDEVDMYNHIDYYMEDKFTTVMESVDVKSIRNFHGNPNMRFSHCVLEYTNKNGDKGSLRGDATLVAFESGNHFKMYRRTDLLKFYEEQIIDIWVKDGLHKAIKKKYSSNGYDEISAFPYEELKQFNPITVMKNIYIEKLLYYD